MIFGIHSCPGGPQEGLPHPSIWPTSNVGTLSSLHLQLSSHLCPLPGPSHPRGWQRGASDHLLASVSVHLPDWAPSRPFLKCSDFCSWLIDVFISISAPRSRGLSVLLTLVPHSPEQHLAHGRCSRNLCSVNEQVETRWASLVPEVELDHPQGCRHVESLPGKPEEAPFEGPGPEHAHTCPPPTGSSGFLGGSAVPLSGTGSSRRPAMPGWAQPGRQGRV